jgi:dihydroorotate dehydrogenase (NAD+) catalytic subunit
MGGIACAADAIELMIAGAAAVAVGTATFTDPTTALRVIDGIETYLQRHGMGSPAELTGSLQS